MPGSCDIYIITRSSPLDTSHWARSRAPALLQESTFTSRALSWSQLPVRLRIWKYFLKWTFNDTWLDDASASLKSLFIPEVSVKWSEVVTWLSNIPLMWVNHSLLSDSPWTLTKSVLDWFCVRKTTAYCLFVVLKVAGKNCRYWHPNLQIFHMKVAYIFA